MDLRDVGATVTDEGVRFRVWAPSARRVELVIERADAPENVLEMSTVGEGVHERFVPGLETGARYRYRMQGKQPFPDPASRFQPEGVHGPSEVVDPRAFCWSDGEWQGVAQKDLVIYELHLGTFTAEGTYAAAAERLPYLRQLGVNAVELMPLADFPGRWNWGYDPAAFWAPSRAYGRPDELRAFVDRAHSLGLAVLLDVVHNHFSPDGAYVAAYGPYLTRRHHTPWGRAMNLDDKGAAGTRGFLIGSALSMLREYHLDGLRLDAVFSLVDESPKHFLAELAEAVAELEGPQRYLIAEDNRNLARMLEPIAAGGQGINAAWADDFHHVVRRTIAGDAHSYFAEFPQTTAGIAETINRGWYYVGQPSLIGGQPRGTDTSRLSVEQFIFFIQNHDQVGNRPFGDRLHHVVDAATYRAASSLLLFLPQVPMLFMGQEWACSNPFLFFTDHHGELGRQVREGRRREHSSFPGVDGEPPDPQQPETFERSKLAWDECDRTPHAGTLALYRDLLARRATFDGAAEAASPIDGALVVQRGCQRLVVALRAGLRVPLAGDPALQWHSEDARYTEQPRPPVRERDSLLFDAPAAVLLG